MRPLIILALAVLCCACTATRQRIALARDLAPSESERVLSVRLVNGDSITFAEPGGQYVGAGPHGTRRAAVHGLDERGEPVDIPHARIAEAEIELEQVSTARTALLAGTVTGAGGFILLILLLSGRVH